MISRLRERFGSPASDSGDAQLGAAMAAWALGTAWALCCLWLWRTGPGSLMPFALAGALLTLWGWRSVRWLHWFPPVTVIAALLDCVAPLEPERAPGGLGYVGMLAFTALLLAFARLLSVGRVPIAGRPREVAVTLFGALGATVALVTAGADARAAATALVAFGAALGIAAKPTGERRVWIAFPFAAIVVGGAAVAGVWTGLGAAFEALLAGGAGRGVPHATPQLLLFTLPVTAGLAFDSGRTLRWFSRVALAVGGAGLGVHALAHPLVLPAVLPLPAPAHAIALLTLLAVAGAVARLAVIGTAVRVRWIGLAAALAMAGVLLVWGRLLEHALAQVLLAFGVALASAVRTAQRRARALGLPPADWPIPRATAAPDTIVPEERAA